MGNYEIMFILAPDLGEAGTKSELDEVRTLITSNKGKITHEDIWGLRDLAYRIKKHDQGFYAVFNFQMEGVAVKALDKPLNINQKVLRFLVVTTPKNYEFKTLEALEAEKLPAVDEIEEAKRVAKAARAAESARRNERPERTERPKPEVKVEKAVEEKPPKKEEKEVKKPKLEDLDEKLKNIINDPDISL